VTTVLQYLVIAAVIGLLLFGLALLLFGRGERLAALPARTSPAQLPERGIEGADVRRVRFALAVRGYRMSDVDWTLDRLADELDRTREQLSTVSGAAADRVESPADPAAMEEAGAESAAFRSVGSVPRESVNRFAANSGVSGGTAGDGSSDAGGAPLGGVGPTDVAPRHDGSARHQDPAGEYRVDPGWTVDADPDMNGAPGPTGSTVTGSSVAGSIPPGSASTAAGAAGPAPISTAEDGHPRPADRGARTVPSVRTEPEA
jgi:DivIVA domain-containing protein